MNIPVTSSHETRSALLCALALIVITSLVFSPVLFNGFAWDDDGFIHSNRMIHTLTLDTVRNILDFTNREENLFVKSIYVPLTILTFAVEYHFFILDAGFYHLDNLILHIFNVLLVYWLFSLLTKRRSICFIVALLFAIHPLHVEPVAWISSRKDVLYGFFFLLAMVLYLYRLKGHQVFYYLSLLSFILSLLSKPAAVTLPFLLLVLDYHRERRITLRVILEKIPFLFFSVLFTAISLYTYHGYWLTSHHQTGEGLSMGKVVYNLCIACHNMLFYIEKTFVPSHLSCIYPAPQMQNGHLPLVYLLSPLFTAALFLLVYALRKQAGKEILAGLFFYLVTIFPTLQIIQVSPGIAADRYSYIPLLGIFYSLAVLGDRAIDRVGENRRGIARVISIAALIVITAALSYQSRQRCHVWKDDITLFGNVLESHPGNSMARINYAMAYYKRGERRKAQHEAQLVLSSVPGSSEAWNILGNVSLDEGRCGEAVQYYSKALLYAPDSSIYLYNRGKAYQQMNDAARALSDYNEAVNRSPGYAEALQNRGSLLQQMGNLDGAMKDYDAVLAVNPTFAMAHIGRGDIYLARGSIAQSIAEYSAAIKIAPGLAHCWINRGIAYGSSGRCDLALADFTRALELDPDSEEAHYNRAQTYRAMGESEKARADEKEIERIRRKKGRR